MYYRPTGLSCGWDADLGADEAGQPAAITLLTVTSQILGTGMQRRWGSTFHCLSWSLRPTRAGSRWVNPRLALNLLFPFSISPFPFSHRGAPSTRPSLEPRPPSPIPAPCSVPLVDAQEWPGNSGTAVKVPSSNPMSGVCPPEEKGASTSIHRGGRRGMAAPQTPPTGTPGRDARADSAGYPRARPVRIPEPSRAALTVNGREAPPHIPGPTRNP